MVPKFRGWHKELEQMIYGKEVCGHIEYTTNLIDALNTMLNEDDYDIEVMQSTGLKDKNGVEIFEGDICEWHIPDMGKPEPDAMIRYVSVVEYRRGSFNLSGYLFPNVRLIKIIGNIYENPELLEQDNEN